MKRFPFIFLIVHFAVVGFSQNLKTTLTYSVQEPSQKNKATPLLIVMHGYGSNENDLSGLAKQIAPQCVIVSLRAPNQVDADGYCWYKIERLANKQIKYKYDQVNESRNKVVAFIREFCTVNKLDSTQVYLMGFSQGAMMSYELLLQSPLKIKGIMALSGRLVDESINNPKQLKHLVNAKIFIAHGTKDEMIDFSESEKANAFFKNHGTKQLLYKSYPTPHTISADEMKDLKIWFSQVLLN